MQEAAPLPPAVRQVCRVVEIHGELVVNIVSIFLSRRRAVTVSLAIYCVGTCVKSQKIEKSAKLWITLGITPGGCGKPSPYVWTSITEF